MKIERIVKKEDEKKMEGQHTKTTKSKTYITKQWKNMKNMAKNKNKKFRRSLINHALPITKH